MTTKEVAALSGVSVRTLHHYDQIGLLRPERNGKNRYRQYSDEDIDRLQQILFFRACGFPLGTIQQLLDSPDFNRERAMDLHRRHLLRERARIDALLHTLEKTIDAAKGGHCMTNQEKFTGFDFSHNPYEEEARRLWGDGPLEESKAKIGSLTDEGRRSLAQGMDTLFAQLAGLRGEDPASGVAQAAVERMYRHFNDNLGYHYSPEAFAGVGQLYVSDPRFTESLDRYGDGLAEFLSQAMGIYAQACSQGDTSPA